MKKAIAMVLILALAVTALVFAGCGGSSGSGDSPEQVVEKFLKAAEKGDADTAYELVTQADKDALTDKQELTEGFTDIFGTSYEVGKGTVSGDTAKVPVKFDMGEQAMGMELEFNIVLHKEDGAWKISGDDTALEMEKTMEDMFGDLETSE